MGLRQPRHRHRGSLAIAVAVGACVAGGLTALAPIAPAAAAAAETPAPDVAAAAGADAGAEATGAGPILNGWMPYWTTSTSLAAYRANADLFASVSPFWYTAKVGDQAGSVRIVEESIGADRKATLASLHAAGKKVIPTIADGSAKGYLAGIMADPAARTRHVNQLVYVVAANGFDGIDIDYEYFGYIDGQGTWPTTRPNWDKFMTELAAAFHSRGLLVTTALPVSSYTVYDHARMGQLLDSVRIMTYDYHVSVPGAIAPLDQVTAETRRLLTMIPASKLVMGIPEYGRDWVAQTAGKPWITNRAGVQVGADACPAGAVTGGHWVVQARDTFTLTNRPGATAVRDAKSGELKVTYTITYASADRTCIVHREAWLADPKSVDDRVRAFTGLGAAGVAFWTVGGEHAAQWDALRYYSASRGPIYWSPLTSGAYAVYGPILTRYQALGLNTSVLGVPVSSQVGAAVAGSRRNDFQFGTIYWSPGTGANEVYGGILNRYRELGADRSALGLPTSGEQPGRTTGTRFNTFVGGRIYWSSPSGAHEVSGAILWRYAQLGSDASVLGLPTQAEHAARLAGAREQGFTRGIVLSSSRTGTWEVYGGILGKYRQLGSEVGLLGLPASGELAGASGSRYQAFAGGRVYWSSATGANEVHGAILAKYLALGAETSALGLPTSDEQGTGVPGWRISNFQHGAIYWSAGTGTIVQLRG